MKVVIKKPNGEKINITNFVDTVTWSGSVNQASRQIEISVLNSPIDKNIPDINIDLGDRILFYEDGKLLINAMVYSRERQSEQGTVTYSGYDDLKRLCESDGKYNFKNTTPERITKAVCGDIKISVGKIVETKVPIKKLIIDSEKLYTVIMKAYTKAFQANGKKYMPIMVNQKLHVVEKGEIVENLLSDTVNITNSTYSESIDGMVNKIKIFDDKGKQIGEVKDDSNIKKFGIFQGIYAKEEGVNATTAAKNMLEGIQKSATVEAIGNIDCISGYGIKIKDTLTKLTGVFWIDNDSHTWENNSHTMSLGLTFQNLMDIQEDGNTSMKTNKKPKTNNNDTKVYISSASAKYHSYATCSGMKNCTEVTKKEALKKGKGECTKCWR